MSRVKVVSNVSVCPFTGDPLLSDRVSEWFCKEHFLPGLPRNELCLRHGAYSGPGRWSGSPVGSTEQCHKKGEMSLHPCFHAAGTVICDYTAFYFNQSLVNLISSLI